MPRFTLSQLSIPRREIDAGGFVGWRYYLKIAHSDSLDFSSRPMPLDQRMPKGGLTMAWWACSSAVFYLVVAATLAGKFGTKNAIIGLLLSVLTYSAIKAVVTRYAIRTGLSIALFSRILFGNAGTALAALIFFVTATYYAVFEGSIIAIRINHVFPIINYKLASLLVVLYSVPLVLGSVQNWLNKFDGILFPFYIFGLVMAVALTVLDTTGASLPLKSAKRLLGTTLVFEDGWRAC